MGIAKLSLLTGETYENGIILFPLEIKRWTDIGLPEGKWPQGTNFDTENTCIAAEVNNEGEPDLAVVATHFWLHL